MFHSYSEMPLHLRQPSHGTPFFHCRTLGRLFVPSDKKFLSWAWLEAKNPQHTQTMCRAGTRKHSMVGQNGTQYKKINNNSENFRRGKIAARGGLLSLAPPLVAGLTMCTLDLFFHVTCVFKVNTVYNKTDLKISFYRCLKRLT